MTEQVVSTYDLDQAIAAAQEEVSFAAAASRLVNSRDFKRVIGQGFMTEFALNLITQRAFSETRHTPAMLESNTRKLDAVSELQYYLRNVDARGARAELQLIDAHKMREDIEAGVYDDSDEETELDLPLE